MDRKRLTLTAKGEDTLSVVVRIAEGEPDYWVFKDVRRYKGKMLELNYEGSKLALENIVQAVCRDILMYAMKTLKKFRICGHIHDEVIVECEPEVTVEQICALMSKTPGWISGLKLDADGYETMFYQKE